MLTHSENKMKENTEKNILEFALKFFSMFMIKIEYANNINMVGSSHQLYRLKKALGCGFNSQFLAKFPLFLSMLTCFRILIAIGF